MKKSEFIDFLLTKSPSGCEKEASNWIKNKYSDVLKTEKDVLGNVYGKLTNNSEKIIMIEGHIDEIGGQILHVTDEGFIIFRENGGLDNATLVSQKVQFTNGVIGVIGKTTLHVEDPENIDKVKEIEEVWIDCGFKNKKEALKHVEIGDFFTFMPNVAELHNNLISSKGIDDKVGAYIAFEVAKKLKQDNFKKYQVYAVGTTQEEVGGYGASVASYNYNPFISISIDVEFASDTPEANKNRIGDIKIGEGLIIKRNTDTNPALFDYFKNYCRKHKLKHQISATAWDGGGTNASLIKHQRSGVATIDIGIANRYMHTSNEVISWNDVETTINNLVEIIKSIPKDFNLI
jgi:endoglucanase